MAKSGEILFQTVNGMVFVLFAIICIYPFYYILLVSISDSYAVSMGNVFLYPIGFTLDNFFRVFQLKGFAMAFAVSASRAVVGTMITLFFSSMLAYICAKNELIGRKWVYRATVFTLYVNAGLIPWFVTMKSLGLQDNFLLYVLPGAVAGFNVVLIKTFMESLPTALEESALVDGAGYFTIFIRIMLPLSTPVLAAVAVFTAVAQWNSWQDNFFLVNKAHLKTLQLILIQFLQQAESIARLVQETGDLNQARESHLDPFQIRTTVTIVTVIPILFVYPFLQKYFAKGILLGAVKG